TLLLTYSAPTAEGQALYDRNGIYEFDETTGALTRLLGEDIPNVYYAYPQRSANTLYYAIYERGVEAQRIEAYDLNTRTVRRIAENATRPVFALFMARQTAIHAQDDTALAEAKRIATEAGWGKTVTLEFDDKTGTMFVKSKGLPDHEILPAYQALSIIDNKTTYVITAQEQYMKVIIPLSQKEWVIDGIPFLDACNGHPNPLAVQYHYHYHTTEAPPYIVSCYAGEIDLGESPLELFTRGVDLSYPPPPVPPGALLPPRPALPQPQTTPTAGK
ncbi:MAG TPA: hypothetical protein PLD47_13625, partial [Aggregatilineales bacterium]|nr:hypothetical protein [Aggregatilineales bacterium]